MDFFLTASVGWFGQSKRLLRSTDIVVGMGGAISLEGCMLSGVYPSLDERLRSQDGCGSDRDNGEGVQTVRGCGILAYRRLARVSVGGGGIQFMMALLRLLKFFEWSLDERSSRAPS